MNKLRRLALFGSVALLLAVPAVAHANERPLVVTEPVVEVFENPCTGETVTLTGEQVIMVHELDDGAGGGHLKFTIHVRGITAVGASGTQYRSVGAHSDYFSTGAGRATTFTFTVAFLVVSQGGAGVLSAAALEPNFLELCSHLALGVDGEVDRRRS